MINWRRQPDKADKKITLSISTEADRVTPKSDGITVKTTLNTDNIVASIFTLLGAWLIQFDEEPEKRKPIRTVGCDFTIGLYFYNDGRTIEMRSDVGDDSLVRSFVSETLDRVLFGVATYI